MRKGTRCVCVCVNVCVCGHNRVDKILGKILEVKSRNYFYCNCTERKLLLLWKIFNYHFFFFLLSRDLGTILTMHISLAVAFPLSHFQESQISHYWASVPCPLPAWHFLPNFWDGFSEPGVYLFVLSPCVSLNLTVRVLGLSFNYST